MIKGDGPQSANDITHRAVSFLGDPHPCVQNEAKVEFSTIPPLSTISTAVCFDAPRAMQHLVGISHKTPTHKLPTARSKKCRLRMKQQRLSTILRGETALDACFRLQSSRFGPSRRIAVNKLSTFDNETSGFWPKTFEIHLPSSVCTIYQRSSIIVQNLP